MNGSGDTVKFKVVMGEGVNETIKRISKTPKGFDELASMVQARLSDRLQGEQEFYIYYEDISNGMIRIEDDFDLKAAMEYCELYSKKTLKLFGRFLGNF